MNFLYILQTQFKKRRIKHSTNKRKWVFFSVQYPELISKNRTDKKKRKNIKFKSGLASLAGLVFCLLSVSTVFATQIKQIVIPPYKLYILPVHKYIYVNTMAIVKYRGISRSFLEKRYPGLDLHIINDLKTAGLQQHPSLWLNASIFKGNKKLDINILQVMTTSLKFPNTVELKYDAKNNPWFLQRLRTFQFLMTKEAVQVGRLKTKPFESYPLNLHLEVSDYLWKNGFRGEKAAITFTNKNANSRVIEDETSEDIYDTPHLANICVNISNDIEEMGYDLRENGIVVVKNIISRTDD